MCEFDTAETYNILLQLDTVLRKEFVELTYTLSSDIAMVSPFADQLVHKINILRRMDGTSNAYIQLSALRKASPMFSGDCGSWVEFNGGCCASTNT